MPSDFRAIIQAQLSDESVENEVKAIGNKHKIVFNNISFDRTALSNAIQSALNGQNININLGNANFNTQALASQAQQAGVNAGQNFVRNFSSQLNQIPNNITFNNLADMKKVLGSLGVTDNNFHSIAQNLRQALISINEISTSIKSNGNLQIKVTGIDKLNNLVTLTTSYDKAGKTVGDTNIRLVQSFEQQEKQIQKNNAAIIKYQANLDSKYGKAIDSNATKPIVNSEHLTALETQYKAVQSAIENLRNADAQTFTVMKSNVDAEIIKLDAMVTEFQRAEYAASLLRAKPVETVRQDELNRLREFMAVISKSGISLSAFKTDIARLEPMIRNVTNADQLKQYLNVLSNAKSEFKALRQEQAKYASSSEVTVLKNKMETWLLRNTKAAKTYGATIKQLITELSQMEAQGGVLVTENKRIANSFREIDTSAAAAGLKGKSFFSAMQGTLTSLSRYFSSITLISYGIRGFRSMYENVLKVDTAMTDLYRITDLSTEQYTRLYDKMTDSAKKYGVALNDIIAGTANWVRYGFSDTGLSEELAEITTMYQHVADLDNKTATQNLLTAYKGFERTLTATYNGNISSVMEHIADVYDKLNNELPVSAAQVAEGVNKTASVLQEAGTSFEQASALIVGGGSVTQDFDAIGNAIKIATLRIHGMKGKLEELGEEVDENISSVSKIQTQILNLTHGKVNIFEDDGESFRNIYDVFHDIANVWGTLKDTESAELLETIAGKNRSNQIMALIQNWETVEKAVTAANNATGTAREEQERYMNSLQGHIDSLNASLQATSNTILKSDLLKDLVNLLNVIVNGLDFTIGKLGTIPTLIGTITAVLSAKNFGRDKMFSLKKYAESNNSSVQICTV